jgi:hypothetical protein
MCSRRVSRESRWYAADVVNSLDGAERLACRKKPIAVLSRHRSDQSLGAVPPVWPHRAPAEAGAVHLP